MNDFLVTTPVRLLSMTTALRMPRACLDGRLYEYSLRSPWKMLVVCSYKWKPLLIPWTWKPLLNLRLHGNALYTELISTN
jgi:hypothetical protein